MKKKTDRQKVKTEFVLNILCFANIQIKPFQLGFMQVS